MAVDTTKDLAKRHSLVAINEEEILEALEKEAEEDVFDDDIASATGKEAQRQVVKDPRKVKEDKAKALCPIRTRYKPEFEEARKAAREAQQKKDRPMRLASRMSRMSFATVQTTGTRASKASRLSGATRLSGGSQLTRLSEPQGEWEAAYTQGSWDQYQAALERRQTRGSLQSAATHTSGHSRLSKYGKYAKRASVELKAVRDVANVMSQDGLNAMTGAGAERGVYNLVGSMFHAAADDLKAHGVEERDLRRVARDRSFIELRSATGFNTSTNAFMEMKEHGRFANSNKMMCQFNLGADEEMAKELEKPRFQNIQRQGLSREQAMKMMVEGLEDDEKERHANQFHKTAVSMQTVEDVWWSNCKGQAAIRRKPEDHEAVYDFADNRISMPKYLQGGHGGQLVTVKPEIDEELGKGEVLVYTMAPKRNFNKCPAKLEDLGGDVITREKGADGHQDYNHGLGGHGHLSKQKLPPSTKVWLDWRDMQQAKRKAQWDAAMAAGLEKRRSMREAERKKHGGGGGEGEFESEGESEADDDAIASMSEHINTARSRSPRDAQSPGRSGRGSGSPGRASGRKTTALSRSPESSARPSGFGSPRTLGSPSGRSARKFATEALDITYIRWDARPPPDSEEMERLMRKVADRLHQEGHHGHHTHGPLSHLAQKHAAEDKAAAGYVDPFADDERECLWLLREIGEQHQDPLDLIFAVPLEEDFEQPPEDLNLEDAAIDAETLWKDIFQPIPKTWSEKFQDMLAFFHRT